MTDPKLSTRIEAGQPSRELLAERVRAGQIKALSIKQPYPHHIFHDGKDVENRDWPTKGRGWFIIKVCTRPEGCVCGGDLPSVRSDCFYLGKVDQTKFEAATEIETLRVENMRLRQALAQISNGLTNQFARLEDVEATIKKEIRDIARATLKGTPHEPK